MPSFSGKDLFVNSTVSSAKIAGQGIIAKAIDSVANPATEYELQLDRYKKIFGGGSQRRYFTVDVIPHESAKPFFKLVTRGLLGVHLSANTNGTISSNGEIGEWRGLYSSIVMPGNTASDGLETFVHRKFLQSSKHSHEITVTYLNDQWNTNYNFWQNYFRVLNSANDDIIQYPAAYMFDVKCVIKDVVNEDILIYTFKDCYAKSLSGQKYSFGESRVEDISIGMYYSNYSYAYSLTDSTSFRNYSIKFTLPTVMSVTEYQMIMKRFGKNLLSRVANRLTNVIADKIAEKKHINEVRIQKNATMNTITDGIVNELARLLKNGGSQRSIALLNMFYNTLQYPGKTPIQSRNETQLELDYSKEDLSTVIAVLESFKNIFPA